MELQGKYITLEKLNGRDNRLISIGSTIIQGYCLDNPEVGYAFYLYSSPKDVKIGEAVIPKHDLPCAWTSQIKEIKTDENILVTNNSIYKVIIKENE